MEEKGLGDIFRAVEVLAPRCTRKISAGMILLKKRPDSIFFGHRGSTGEGARKNRNNPDF